MVSTPCSLAVVISPTHQCLGVVRDHAKKKAEILEAHLGMVPEAYLEEPGKATPALFEVTKEDLVGVPSLHARDLQQVGSPRRRSDMRTKNTAMSNTATILPSV